MNMTTGQRRLVIAAAVLMPLTLLYLWSRDRSRAEERQRAAEAAALHRDHSRIEAQRFAGFREARAAEERGEVRVVAPSADDWEAAEADLRSHALGFVGVSWYDNLTEFRVSDGVAEAYTDLYPDSDATAPAKSLKAMMLGWANGKDNPHRIRWVRVYDKFGDVIDSQATTR
ncbi:MAG: hypothetical protein DWQ34_22665 [Planctomycetota bacterium]|nr:MAG: hypothetical protein DWQ34_22665 [Planctomycetota bacterium]REK30648.1 MAG: hypothetical protein DWQ41_01480 [Planctomycetota bacterium]REK33022.1 MAG: hypothetical protein DWQ45_15580 [Planctomycetota bacterium]